MMRIELTGGGVAIAYRPDPSFDGDIEGGRITPRLATADEVKTGKSKSGKPVIVVLARPVIAAQLFDRIRRYGYDGQYLGSSQLVNGPLGREWGWDAGQLLSNGERPQANLLWSLEPVERDASGAIVAARQVALDPGGRHTVIVLQCHCQSGGMA